MGKYRTQPRTNRGEAKVKLGHISSRFLIFLEVAAMHHAFWRRRGWTNLDTALTELTLVKKNKVCGSISNSRGEVRSSLEEWPTYPTAWGTSSLHCPAGTAPQHRTTRAHISCHTHPFQFNEGWLPPKRTAQIISTILLVSFILTPNIPVTQPCQSYFSKVSRIHPLLFLLLPLPSPGCHLLLSRPF